MEALVSIVALIISLVSLVRTRVIDTKLIALQEESAKLAALQRAELERQIEDRQRCEVSAYWYLGLNGANRIAVKNVGLVNAYDVNFEFRPTAGNVSPAVQGELERVFPINILSPQRESTFIIAPHSETGSNWPVFITWKDEGGKSYSTDLLLGE